MLYRLNVMTMKRTIIPLLIVILILSSCNLTNNSTVILWTDKPEMAAYVEEFNSIQEKYRIEIIYKKEPEQALKNQDSPVDIVISEFLNSPETIGLFTPLTDIYAKEAMDLSIFYTGLLDLCYKNGELFFLPISFNLPAIMLKREETQNNIPNFYLNSEDMESAALNFNKKSRAKFEMMGFSPRWDSEVLFLNAVLMNTDFHLTNTGVLSWNEKKLKESIQLSSDWSNNTNGGLKQEEEFTTKFLYDPSYKLIAENRILFYYSDIVSFFEISPDKRKDLDFRWFAAENKIPVLGNILFTGIPTAAKNRKGSAEFIHWFFNPETQKNLLKSTQIKRMDTFGFANGFSSLPEINKNQLPIIYPNLVGNIPQESSLIFPKALPPYWEELKTNVIEPWLYDQTSGNPQKISLQNAIEEWLKQRS